MRLYIVGYVLNCIICFSFQLSGCGGVSWSVLFLYVYSFGHSVTKCQKVSLSSPQSLYSGLVVGFVLNCM